MTPSSPPHEPAPPPPRIAPDPCGAGRVQARLGQPYREALGTTLLRESGASTLRVIRPGEAHTLEYRAARLEVRLDREARITAIRCG